MWFAIILFIISFFCLAKAINDIVLKKREEKERENEIICEGAKYNAEYSIELQHICGLPLSENSTCIVHLCHNQIVIEGTGEIFKLQKNKIIDMNIKSSKEVQNSISGAIGGYMLLGPIGAFLNATSTEIHKFFIIIYRNDKNEEKCISFDIKDNMNNFQDIRYYIDEFKYSIIDKTETEL